MADYQLTKTGAEIDALHSQQEWMFATKTISTALSGDVTIDPADGHRQKANVDGNIDTLSCALSATYPAVILELTTDGAYTITLEATSSYPDADWETDGAGGIELPDTGKCVIVLFLSADGTTKYAVLSITEVA